MVEENIVSETDNAEEPKKVKRAGRPKGSKAEYVTKEDFGQLLDLVSELSKKLEKGQEPVKDEAAPVASPENPLPYIPINPEWRKIVNEELGEDFGMDVRYSSGGDVVMFDIIVPISKSNAPKEYLAVHKIDRRTKSLNPTAGGVGVRQWCQMVKRNLSHPR